MPTRNTDVVPATIATIPSSGSAYGRRTRSTTAAITRGTRAICSTTCHWYGFCGALLT